VGSGKFNAAKIAFKCCRAGLTAYQEKKSDNYKGEQIKPTIRYVKLTRYMTLVIQISYLRFIL